MYTSVLLLGSNWGVGFMGGADVQSCSAPMYAPGEVVTSLDYCTIVGKILVTPW